MKDSAAVVTPMAFTVDQVACTAQSLADPLHVGWYTMIVQLFDAPLGPGSEVLSTGAAAAVRIAASRQTHGDLFLHAVQGFGKIDLILDLNFGDPLVLSPNVPFGDVTLYAGDTQAFSLTADETCSTVYYLRGQQVGVDAYSLNANDLIVGEAYRVDAVAFNVDGSRAASGTWSATVSDFNPGLVHGSFIAPAAGNYEVTLYPSAGGTLVTPIVSAGGLTTFAISGLAADNYKMRIIGLEPAGAEPYEFWREASDPTGATAFVYPLTAPFSFDFGALSFQY